MIRWSKIAAHFPGRTDNEIKNHWNTRIKKRLKLLGVDPVTHMPLTMDQQKELVSDDNKKQRNQLLIHPLTSSSKGCDMNKSLNSNDGCIEQVSKTPGKKEEEEENKVIWSWGDHMHTTDVSNQNEMIYSNSNLGFGSWMSQETNTSTTSSFSSSSFSHPHQHVDDYSSLVSMGESAYLQENSLMQWVESMSMDSIFEWDSFNPFEQDLLFLGNRQSAS